MRGAALAAASMQLELERQSSASGIVWVLVGKAPIRVGGHSIGVLGMYEVLDKKGANKLFAKRAMEGR